MDPLRTLARPLLAAPLVLDGVDACLRPGPHVDKIAAVSPVLERAGLPPLMDSDARLMTRASGAVTVLAGLGLATGRAPRACAAALAAMSVPLAVVNHPVWLASGRQERREAATGAVRALALGAGLVMAALDREGAPSRAWKRAERARLAAEAGEH